MLSTWIGRSENSVVGSGSGRYLRTTGSGPNAANPLGEGSLLLSNITKFFGDWHLARIYQHISARFHLADWYQTLGKKLKTLNGLYELLSHDRNNRWMLILEATIVLLFVIDLALLVAGLQTS